MIGPADLAVNEGESLIVYAVGSLDGDTLGVLTETVTGLGSNPTRVDTGNSPIDNGGTGVNMVLLLLAGAAGLGAVGTLVARSRRVEA